MHTSLRRGPTAFIKFAKGSTTLNQGHGSEDGEMKCNRRDIERESLKGVVGGMRVGRMEEDEDKGQASARATMGETEHLVPRLPGESTV